MRILFVAMSESVHAARWVSQIDGLGWEIYLFPVARADLHPTFRRIRYFNPYAIPPRTADPSVRVFPWASPAFYMDAIQTRLRKTPVTTWREAALAKCIQVIQPDLVHSLEMQHAGYLVLGARERLQGKFPPWMVSIWGSDIYLFGRMKEHRERVQAVLRGCDYYMCECQRDIGLAKQLGLRGKIMPRIPGQGGFHLDQLAALPVVKPCSSRRVILLKGYQHWAGRGLVGLRALARCADVLKDYEIVIYSSYPDVDLAAEVTALETGLNIRIQPPCSHEEVLKLFGQARIFIGLSISDGLANSLVEAMAMGAFPIQSSTACVDEWIEDGRTGFSVPPEDPDVIEKAIRRALADDALVDGAAEANARTTRERLDAAKIQPQVVNMYRELLPEPEK